MFLCTLRSMTFWCKCLAFEVYKATEGLKRTPYNMSVLVLPGSAEPFPVFQKQKAWADCPSRELPPGNYLICMNEQLRCTGLLPLRCGPWWAQGWT